MPFNDKRHLLAHLTESRTVKIELGCGPRKRYPGSIGIDSIDFDCVDIVGDVLEVLSAFPPASADLVTSSHFLEHVQELERVLEEIERVLKPGATMEAVVPHFSNPYYYSDPTHIRPFGLYSFSYLAVDDHFRRKVPGYVRTALRVRSADLVFKSAPPFYGRHGFKKLLGAIFNATRYLQELYEENLCFLFPCYEIRFVLQKVSA